MFEIPTLPDLVARVRAAFRANMPGSDAYLWPNNLNPTAKVIGGVAHGLFGFADYIQRQKFALTADSENLDLHGEEIGLSRRPTAPASGIITIVVTAAVSVLVNARFRRSDGVEYLAVNGGSLTGAGSLSLSVISATDGSATNAVPGAALEIVSGVDGDDGALASVGDAGITGGVDTESDDDFRARILFRKRNPVHGGAPADYVQWGTELAGVTRIFVERRWQGGGTLRVFVLMDGLFADGIPDAANVERVNDYIQARAPAGAIVAVQAPVAVPIDIEVVGLSPNTADVQMAAAAELRSTFLRNSRVCGADESFDSMPYLASPFTFSLSWLWQAVANASGERRHRIASPASDIVLAPGQIATLGAVTFTS